VLSYFSNKLRNCVLVVMTELPPTSFISQPYSRISTVDSPGNRRVLRCHASGSPSPVYQWLKDGRPLSPTNTSAIAFVIQRIQRSDAGSYECIASNHHGSLLSIAAQVNVACKLFIHRVSRVSKKLQKCFFYKVVKCLPNLTIFGTQIAQRFM